MFTIKRAIAASACLFLTACGPEWEVVRVTDVVPYGNSRTAGSGVMYVRANMLKEKDVILEPKMAPKEKSLKETQEILDTISEDRGDKVFNEKQKKK